MARLTSLLHGEYHCTASLCCSSASILHRCMNPPLPPCPFLCGVDRMQVRYKVGEDLGLDMHTDDSDVTFNTCLGEPGFTASGLTFCGILGKNDHRRFKMRYAHVLGRCIMHLGRQVHTLSSTMRTSHVWGSHALGSHSSCLGVGELAVFVVPWHDHRDTAQTTSHKAGALT